ncbi:hypothetical protein PF001_g508 [Phytophthora fragariae]|uniref:Uncharacterized protein n=1 Tax=Phytophthora fragariae TaxID=53985 RepID=A0A6A4EQV0_9STRA|nr:hypothetical protein PF003_g29191 [Phytophthora fragariae]KAE9330252.1 hypothetical protein PF001_g508 [Phytophthora fragariae]
MDGKSERHKLKRAVSAHTDASAVTPTGNARDDRDGDGSGGDSDSVRASDQTIAIFNRIFVPRIVRPIAKPLTCAIPPITGSNRLRKKSKHNRGHNRARGHKTRNLRPAEGLLRAGSCRLQQFALDRTSA